MSGPRRTGFPRTAWVSGAVLVAAAAAAAILGGREAKTGAIGDGRARVKVVEVRRSSLEGEIRAAGFLRSRLDVTVAAERAGRVVELPVAEGAPVARGAAVAHLDDTVAAANLERARGVAREAALDPGFPAADLLRVREQVRLAEHELRLHHPVAPLDGVLEIHHVDPGEYVQPGAPLVDVIDPDHLVLDADVDPEALPALTPGARVPVDVLGETLEGEIARVATRADARTRRFRVEVALEARAGWPRPGMHAEARFPVPRGPLALHLPKEAVRTDRGQTGVFLVVEGVARWRPVRVVDVYHRPDLVRAEEGALPEGAKLVVSGFPGLRDGARVEVAE